MKKFRFINWLVNGKEGTKVAIAKKLGISISTVYRWLNDPAVIKSCKEIKKLKKKLFSNAN